jgi:hypothetical protein
MKLPFRITITRGATILYTETRNDTTELLGKQRLYPGDSYTLQFPTGDVSFKWTDNGCFILDVAPKDDV